MLTEKNYLEITNKFKYIIFLCIYFFFYPFCKLFYGKNTNWLICERGDDAQDNGYFFFKFLREKHKELKVYYLIKKNSPDYKKVSSIGTTVEFGSIKHFFLAIGCPVKISSHLFGYAPWITMTEYYRRNKTKDCHVFLQHGITKNFHKGLCGNNCKSINLFVCGAKKEYEAILREFNYSPDVVQYTGFARFDSLLDGEMKRQILFMPTWRSNLSQLDNDGFIHTDYFREWNNIINNETILSYCRKNNIKIAFYLHYSFQKYAHLFKGNDVVNVLEFGKIAVQDLLKESILLVTDFSSVYFDFAYMNKPIIYFQFDEATFYDNHYAKGYFDYRKDGFGDVCLTMREVESSFGHITNNNFAVEKKYNDRLKCFFEYRDRHNCDRIFDAIMRIK